MRHPIHTTRIPEIDDQHRTIDNLIELYSKASNRADEQQHLTALFQAAQTHFQFLEHFFDVKFPLEFKQRQNELLDLLSLRIQQRIKGEIDQKVLAAQLRRMFLLNISAHENKLHPPA